MDRSRRWSVFRAREWTALSASRPTARLAVALSRELLYTTDPVIEKSNIAWLQIAVFERREREVTQISDVGGKSVRVPKTTMGLFTGAVVFLAFAAAASAHSAKAVTCKASGNHSVEHTATDGTECQASADTGGKSKAIAKTGGLAQASSDTRGRANATATEMGTAEASADSRANANADASGSGTAKASADSRANATANASGSGTAEASADGSAGKCAATAKAETSGTAQASCEAGGFAHATATNGGTAEAFDDGPPLCSPGPPPGTATVESSGGNC